MMATHITLSRLEVESILKNLDDACNDIDWHPDLDDHDVDRLTLLLGEVAQIVYAKLEEAEAAPVTAQN